MRLLRNCFTSVIAVLIAGTLLTGCNKCDGNEPVLSAEEQSWIPYQTMQDSMVFVNQQGKKEAYLFLGRRIFTTEYDPDGFLKKICPEDRTAEGIYEIGEKAGFQANKTAFRVHIAKTNARTDKTFYWQYLRGNSYFYGFNDYADSLEVAGTMYKEVHIFVNDTTNAANYQGPFTHKLYFSKSFGLIRYDNTGNQIWERQP